MDDIGLPHHLHGAVALVAAVAVILAADGVFRLIMLKKGRRCIQIVSERKLTRVVVVFLRFLRHDKLSIKQK